MTLFIQRLGMHSAAGRFRLLHGTACLLTAACTGFAYAENAHAQSCALPDAVEAFVPGEGGGRGKEYLPGSVLGLPDTVARRDVPTIDAKQVVSLGVGGEIVLRFDDAVIVDGPGPDFTVFENAFYYVTGGKERIYAEPAEVSVSSDGVEFVSFAFDPTTLNGCAGVTPTFGDREPCDPAVSGGDAFDLSDVGIDSVRYIRLRDVTDVILEDKDHPFYDITLNGFDLDAVIGVNTMPLGISGVRDAVAASGNVHVRFRNGSSTVVAESELTVGGDIGHRLYDMNGTEILSLGEQVGYPGLNRTEIDLADLPSGIYLLRSTLDGIRIASNVIRVVR